MRRILNYIRERKGLKAVEGTEFLSLQRLRVLTRSHTSDPVTGPVWPRGLGRGIVILFHDRGTRRGVMVSSTPRPYFTPGRDPVPIVQEDGWAPRPIWKGGEPRPHRDSIPDRPARSQSLYQLSYPVHPDTKDPL